MSRVRIRKISLGPTRTQKQIPAWSCVVRATAGQECRVSQAGNLIVSTSNQSLRAWFCTSAQAPPKAQGHQQQSWA